MTGTSWQFAMVMARRLATRNGVRMKVRGHLMPSGDWIYIVVVPGTPMAGSGYVP